MFLKALTLKGFKSFADPATLQLEPGVTVVVGPNGSGKSNVVDAVAWVLGAQGPRTVRSSKMEDVIFAGSADRPPLGRAEVSLTIDNRAGRLPGGLAEITITRTLFRSGESEYAINGEPCRLLDVQELLSDSGVGRQQHVIVGQGQLDHVLNARPEDRRAIVEEAAGVLKHRRRRERAERRLAATEENLERLGDLLREVRRQMRPLERQAAAARSHSALADELRALRLHLVGRDLRALEERRLGAGDERDRLRTMEDELHRSLAELDAAADATTAQLSSRREEDVVGALTRVQALGERARGLGRVLAERRRSLDRALDAAADVDVVSALEAESARLGAELVLVDHDASDLEPERTSLELDEQALAQALSDHGAAFGGISELRRAEEAYAVGQVQVAPLRGALERDEANVARLDDRLGALEHRREELQSEQTDLAGELAALAGESEAAGPRSEGALEVASAAASELETAEGSFRRAEAARHRLEAHAEAAEGACAEAEGAAGAERLAGARGVVGLLRQLVEVEDGFALAFEAAVGAAAAAVVVDGTSEARDALEHLERGDSAGSILALGLVGSHSDSTVPTPSGLEPLRPLVRPVLPALGALLDALLARAVVAPGDWRSAVDVALAHPELVVVTRHGDRLSTRGWIVRAARDTRAAAQEARAGARRAAGLADEAARVLEIARRKSEAAAAAAAEAVRHVERLVERRRAIEQAQSRVAEELEGLQREWSETTRHRAVLVERYDTDAAHLVELERRLQGLQVEAAAASQRRREVESAERALDERRRALEIARRELEVRQAGLSERRAVLASRSAELERRLAGHASERARAGERRRGIEAELTAVGRLSAAAERAGERVALVAERLRELRARQVDAVRAGGARLEALRAERAGTAQRLEQARSRAQELELELAESGVRHEAAVEALRRELGCEPSVAMASPCPALPEGTSAAQRAANLEEELAKLGPVNPLALEELGGLEERHRFLESQVDDVRRSRRELQQLIREVDDEIVRVFTDAFADVNAHFQVLVSTLFPGGTGRLTLTEPEDLLDTGVEVEARPAGKNVRKLSLLSGGERSLVALAFLFAVFRSRPSPFYLMDEVEAALDDVNLHRFLDLLHEFRGEVQLIVVSHQKRTMEAADALYGVTMTPGGSSKVVSQKVRRQAADEAATAAAG